MLARLPLAGLAIQEAMAALALSTVVVPHDSIVIFGKGRLNGLQAFMELQKYLVVHGRIEVKGPGDVVMHTDAAVEKLLGVKSLPFVEAATRLFDTFGACSSLNAADRQAIKAADPAIQRPGAVPALRFSGEARPTSA